MPIRAACQFPARSMKFDCYFFEDIAVTINRPGLCRVSTLQPNVIQRMPD